MDYLQYLYLHGLLLSFPYVLNLVINGLPSIQDGARYEEMVSLLESFKPCYKWITFNTSRQSVMLRNS